MRYIGLIFIILLFSGCGIVNLGYKSQKQNLPTYQQKVKNEQCTYLFGPLDTNQKKSIFDMEKKEAFQELIKNTIKKANDDGLYGNKLVNIDIQEGGYTSPIASKLCLYISANLIYDKFLDQ